MYYSIMKIFASSPYATFNSKEWNSLISKNDKFVNTPIKVQKKYYRNPTFIEIKKTKPSQVNNQLHVQMQLIFA